MGIGERIGQIAKMKKISLKELSRQIDMPYTTLYHMVSRDSKVDFDTACKVANALGVRVPDLYPEGMQAEPILNWMESKGIPIVVGPGEAYWNSVKEYKERQEKSAQQKDDRETKLLEYFRKLNNTGQDVALERVQELTQLNKYQLQSVDSGSTEK